MEQAQVSQKDLFPAVDNTAVPPAPSDRPVLTERIVEVKDDKIREPLTADQSGQLEQIMREVAIPPNIETSFMASNQEEVVKSEPREQVQSMQASDDTLSSNMEATLFGKLVNEGNMLEIMSSIESRLSDGEWLRAAQKVNDVLVSKEFILARIEVTQQTEVEAAKKIVRDHKQYIVETLNIPQLSTRDFCWDALVYKSAPSSLEYYARNYGSLDKFSPYDLAAVVEIESQCRQLIQMKCSEFRTRTNTQEDSFIPDESIFLESMVGGVVDNMRSERVSQMGQGKLIEYVNSLQSTFLSGRLPGAVDPAKIYACHDLVTAAELRGTIQKMSEQQIAQLSSQLKNMDVMMAAYKTAGELQGEGWTTNQRVSVNQKAKIDEQTRRISKLLGDDYDHPIKQQQNILSGSANSMKQQMQLAAGDVVVSQNVGQRELSKQQLSVLLACLRQRANAVQTTDWELVGEVDFEHLEIVRFLSRQAGNGDPICSELYRIATVVLTSYAGGHNISKFASKQIPNELRDLIMYNISGKIKQMVADVAAFKDDPNKQAAYAQCVLKAIAQKQRIAMEYRDRLERKKARSTIQAQLQQ